jgi:hypothetical protein
MIDAFIRKPYIRFQSIYLFQLSPSLDGGHFRYTKTLGFSQIINTITSLAKAEKGCGYYFSPSKDGGN